MKKTFQLKHLIIGTTIIGVVVFIVVYLTGKNSPGKEVYAESVILSRWLNGDSCNPVCWEGIIPGTTTMKDAIEILKKNDLVNQNGINVVDDYEKLDFGEIYWDWNDSQGGGRIFYKLSGDETANIVYAISPSIACCARLKDVIKVYEEPEYIKININDVPELDTPVYTYTLFWIKKGFFVRGGPSKEHQIDGNFLVSSIEFFEPSMEGLFLSQGEIGPNLVPWQGYGDQNLYISNK